MLSWTSTSLGLTGLLAGPKAFHEIVESERHTRYIFLCLFRDRVLCVTALTALELAL